MKTNPEIVPVSRRDFLTTGGVAVGSALVSSLVAPGFVHAANNETLKIALIGCGGRGSGAADQALNVEGTKLVALADAFQDQLQGGLQNLKKQHGEKVDVPPARQFVGLDAYKDAIATADVVILATPPGFRPGHFEEAIKQGKHVFMEKPVAVDGPGVRRVLAAAEESKKKNLKVCVGLQRHHQLGYIETIKRIQDGDIGDVLAMRCYWNGSTPWVKTRESLDKKYGRNLTEMEYQMRNWYYFVWLCGDHIVEQHIHNLDVGNWIKGGYPAKASGMGGCEVRKGKDYGEIFDHHAVEFEYEDGTRMFSQCRHIVGCWNSVSEHVTGTKGTGDVSGYVLRGEKSWRFRDKDKEKNPYQQEHDDFFAAIRSDSPFNEAENGAKSSLTAIMGRMATYTGRVIEWEQALNSGVGTFPDRLAWDAPPKDLPGPDGMYALAVPGNDEWVKRVV